jgi:hypothetical protein
VARQTKRVAYPPPTRLACPPVHHAKPAPDGPSPRPPAQRSQASPTNATSDMSLTQATNGPPPCELTAPSSLQRPVRTRSQTATRASSVVPPAKEANQRPSTGYRRTNSRSGLSVKHPPAANVLPEPHNTKYGQRCMKQRSRLPIRYPNARYAIRQPMGARPGQRLPQGHRERDRRRRRHRWGNTQHQPPSRRAYAPDLRGALRLHDPTTMPESHRTANIHAPDKPTYRRRPHTRPHRDRRSGKPIDRGFRADHSRQHTTIAAHRSHGRFHAARRCYVHRNLD